MIIHNLGPQIILWLLVGVAFIGTSISLTKTVKKAKDEKKKKGLIVPIVPKKRTQCPFHGFQRFGRNLVDTGGNACALFDRLSPCGMPQPSWGGCGIMSVSQKQALIQSKNVKSLIFFPDEFSLNEKKYKGESFAEWYFHITTSGKPINEERSVIDEKR
jgi:hypothetical protein